MRGDVLLLAGLTALVGCREDRPVEPRPGNLSTVASSVETAQSARPKASVAIAPPKPAPAAPDPVSLAKAREGSHVRSDERVVL